MLDRLLITAVPPPASLLDVCCGAGTIARYLVDKGYRVTGIDASHEMLAHASADVPEAHFQLADVRDFHLDTQHDGALSTFDSLNHMLTLEDLRQAFTQIGAALKPGAPFVFDMSLEEAYKTEWKQTCNIINDNEACIIRGQYDETTRIGATQITRFHATGQTWGRTDVEWHTRCYAPQEVAELLRQSGFGKITTHSLDAELGPNRIAYLAHKPSV